MNITQRIEELRKDKGWSVAKLARKAKIPTVSLRVMLSRDDVNNYSVPTLMKLADALEITVSELTREDKEEFIKPKLSRKQMLQLQEAINRTIESFFENDHSQLVVDKSTGEVIDDN
jgi:transcriptional regulator with XRE-family HTH domain